MFFMKIKIILVEGKNNNNYLGQKELQIKGYNKYII